MGLKGGCESGKLLQLNYQFRKGGEWPLTLKVWASRGRKTLAAKMFFRPSYTHPDPQFAAPDITRTTSLQPVQRDGCQAVDQHKQCKASCTPLESRLT